MFGNLVAISSTGLFNDIIWATVYHRNDTLNNGYVTVFLEYASEVNEKSFIDALELLIRSSGSCVIAESPTYYHSYKPVLKSIQSLNASNLPFTEELVNGVKPKAKAPHLDMTFTRGLLFKCECDNKIVPSYRSMALDCKHNRPIEVDEYVDFDTEDDDEKSVLDPSQTIAIKSLLSNRIGIVQGPPGTGKTYLGVQLTNVLLNLKNFRDEPAIQGPILILTYKNHALDEFSKHILENWSVFREHGSFIRVGGRSKDAEMQNYSINKFINRSGNIEHGLRKKRDELTHELQEAIQQFCGKCMQLDYQVALKHFDNVQIENLLKKFSDIDAGFRKELAAMIKQHNGLENIGAILFSLLSEDRFYQPGIENLENLFNLAFEAWLPCDDITNQIKDLESQKKYEAIKKAKLYERLNESHTNQADDEELQDDPVAIQRLIEERYEAAGVSVDRGKEIHLTRISWSVENADSPYETRKYPRCLQSLGLVSKIIAAKTDLGNLRYISNPWDLSETERLHFLQAMLLRQSELASEKLKSLFNEYENLSEQIRKLEKSREAEALKNARVIAMTITGAAIRNDVLNAVKPSVIIVEEAAEINEAQLIALLGEHVQNLILIGDHKQLRPQIECFTLVKKFNFDVSMMERLINNNLPFATLAAQNRMRTDISKYLRDIYPDLQDNPRVLTIKPVNCMETNCFFWNHNWPETSGRSHSNKTEAKAVIDFVKFLHKFNGYPLNSITVLSGYQGQTAELRKMARNDPEICTSRESENRLDIQTIDMFQGDENEIIIVSLVRNNNQRNPGFLGILNRRCVAQSRSKSGVYFLGNAQTLCGREKSDASAVWKPFLDQLRNDGCVDDKITLKCRNHEHIKIELNVGDRFPTAPFCSTICDVLMPCGEHRCDLKCQPYHSDHIHETCKKRVNFMHQCGKHMGVKMCYEDETSFRCPNPCTHIYHEEDPNLGSHLCKAVCGSVHSHNYCLKQIDFLCPDNGHPLSRKCFQEESQIKCKESVEFTYSFCNVHKDKKLCFEKASAKECRHKCLKKMEPCGHNCPERCEPDHHHHRGLATIIKIKQFLSHGLMISHN